MRESGREAAYLVAKRPQSGAARSYIPIGKCPTPVRDGDGQWGRVVSGAVVGSPVMAKLTVGPALVQFDRSCPSDLTDIHGSGTS